MTTIPKTFPDSTPRWAAWIMHWPGIALAFFWGFAEGTLFFILPDVPLSFVALFRPRRAWLHLAAIVAGAVLGGALMFSWSSRDSAAHTVVGSVPLVSQAMFRRADQDFSEHGLWGVALGPLRGIPYKVYAVEAPAYTSLWPFLLITIPARLWRLLAVWLGFSSAGALLRRAGRGTLAPVYSCRVLDRDLRSLLGEGEISPTILFDLQTRCAQWTKK